MFSFLRKDVDETTSGKLRVTSLVVAPIVNATIVNATHVIAPIVNATFVTAPVVNATMVNATLVNATMVNSTIVTASSITAASANITGSVNASVVRGGHYSNDGSQGMTDASHYYMCIGDKCKEWCQLQIKDGLIVGCV